MQITVLIPSQEEEAAGVEHLVPVVGKSDSSARSRPLRIAISSYTCSALTHALLEFVVRHGPQTLGHLRRHELRLVLSQERLHLRLHLLRAAHGCGPLNVVAEMLSHSRQPQQKSTSLFAVNLWHLILLSKIFSVYDGNIVMNRFRWR
jgi:hypothetical protein